MRFNFSAKEPIIWPLIQRLFPGADLNNVAFTWGKTIYTKRTLTFDQVEHEKVHIRQQKNKLWGFFCILWYAFSVKYRKRCELEAFQRQWLALGRDKKATLYIAGRMSHAIYGRGKAPMWNYKEAIHLLDY